MRRSKTSWKFLSLLILLHACTASPDSTLEDLKIGAPFNPIILSADTTYLELSTYLPFVLPLDSISGPFVLNKKQDVLQIVDTSIHSNGLRELVFHSSGIPYTAVVSKPGPTIEHNNPIRLVQFSRESVHFSVPEQAFTAVYWNNLKLHFEIKEGLAVVLLPPFAKYIDRGHLTVYSKGPNTPIYHMLVPLKKGKVITELNKLRQDQVTNTIAHPLIGLRSNAAFVKPLLEFQKQMIEKPASLALMYGAKRLLNKSDSASLYSCTYHEETAYMLINAGKGDVSLSADTISLSASGPEVVHRLISQ